MRTEADEITFMNDLLIRRIPGEWPQAWMRLPVVEQQWRGRLFLVTYIMSGSIPFSWHMALGNDPENVADNRAFLAGISDEEISAGLDAMGGC